MLLGRVTVCPRGRCGRFNTREDCGDDALSAKRFEDPKISVDEMESLEVARVTRLVRSGFLGSIEVVYVC